MNSRKAKAIFSRLFGTNKNPLLTQISAAPLASVQRAACHLSVITSNGSAQLLSIAASLVALWDCLNRPPSAVEPRSERRGQVVSGNLSDHTSSYWCSLEGKWFQMSYETLELTSVDVGWVCFILVLFIGLIPADSDSTRGTAPFSPGAQAVWQTVARRRCQASHQPALLRQEAWVNAETSGLEKTSPPAAPPSQQGSQGQAGRLYLKNSLRRLSLGAAVHPNTCSGPIDSQWAVTKHGWSPRSQESHWRQEEVLAIPPIIPHYFNKSVT